jgi:hypothetical protein
MSRTKLISSGLPQVSKSNETIYEGQFDT